MQKKEYICMYLCMHTYVCMSRQRLGIHGFALRLKPYPGGLVHSTQLAALHEPRSPEPVPRSLALCLDLHYRCCAHLMLVVPTVLKSHTCGSSAQGSRINPCNSSGRISPASWRTAAMAVAATAGAPSQGESWVTAWSGQGDH